MFFGHQQAFVSEVCKFGTINTTSDLRKTRSLLSILLLCTYSTACKKNHLLSPQPPGVDASNARRTDGTTSDKDLWQCDVGNHPVNEKCEIWLFRETNAPLSAFSVIFSVVFTRDLIQNRKSVRTSGTLNKRHTKSHPPPKRIHPYSLHSFYLSIELGISGVIDSLFLIDDRTIA